MTSDHTSVDAAAQDATFAAIKDHHARLARTMADHALTIERAVDRLGQPFERAKALVAFSVREVLPHAVAEERTLYAAGAELPEAALLVQAMVREHVILRDLVARLDQARTPGETAGAAAALNALFQAHLEKENDLVLPALIEAGVDLAALLDGMHDILGEHTEPSDGETEESHGCACLGIDASGEHGETAYLVDGDLEVRTIAHGERHDQIFATFRSLPAG